MFKDRIDAANHIFDLIKEFAKEIEIIIGIPRGGTVVGKELSKRLNCEYTNILTKKIGSPWNREIAIGAVASDGSHYLNEKLIKYYNISHEYINSSMKVSLEKIENLKSKYESNVPSNKKILLIDDGIATGYTVLSAIEALKKRNNIVYVATPVIAKDTYDMLKAQCDGVYANIVDENFKAVGFYYEDFSQVDEEIIDLFNQEKNKEEV